jgi:hypothetical protein
MCRRAHRMSSASSTQPQTAVRGGPSAAAVLQVSVEATRRLPGTEVDEILEFVTGQTLQMTGTDLVVLALPGEGHRQLTIRHAAGNGAGQRQLPSVTRSSARLRADRRLGALGQRVIHCRERSQIVSFCVGGAERRVTFTAAAGSTGGRRRRCKRCRRCRRPSAVLANLPYRRSRAPATGLCVGDAPRYGRAAAGQAVQVSIGLWP